MHGEMTTVSSGQPDIPEGENSAENNAMPDIAAVDRERLRVSAPLRVKVLFPLPLVKAYDYLIPDGLAALQTGAWVKAPFAGRKAIGVVWGVVGGASSDAEPTPADADNVDADNIDAAKLKSIEHVFSAPPLAGSVIDFVNWVAAYTMFPLGSVLRLVARANDALDPPKGKTGFVISSTGEASVKMTPGRQAILAVMENSDEPMTAAEIAEKAGVSDSVVRGFAKAGALAAVQIDPDPPFSEPDPNLPGRTLSGEQTRAAKAIIDAVTKGEGGATLLDGVTGSGKTEVYLEAAAAALKKDPAAQILIMLPEIALTTPFLDRIEERFGAAPAPWHSGIGSAMRRRVWRRVNEGQARIVVGARSALFLPYRNLQLIVVDEEHEAAYKQEDGVIYQARDMAVVRGAKGKFPVVLASATPSLETVVNVDRGRYGLERLTARFGGAQMPSVDLVDMRRDGPAAGEWLSPPLIGAVGERLAAGEQTLLFLNRRGYAPLTICRKCGHRMKAPHSDTWLVEHRFSKRLVCHHTGFAMPKPDACPECNAVGSLTACGPGVERVAEEVAARWPDARRAVLSSDIRGGGIAMRATLDAMRENEIDILVATQVAAKGHHFPNLTLVGVVDADMGLAGGDLRAAERTYQLISQVAGRAGREIGKGRNPGRAILQSYQPAAPVLSSLVSGDRDAFLAAEAEGRQKLGFPPYGRLAAIKLRSPDESALCDSAEAHRAAIPDADGVEVWGPAPAPVYRLRGEARMRFLVKARRDVHIQGFLNAWLSKVKLRGPIRRAVDIDPYSFL